MSKPLGKSIWSPKEVEQDLKLQEELDENDDDFNEEDSIEYSGSEIEVCTICGEEACVCESEEEQSEEEEEEEEEEPLSQNRKPVAMVERTYYYEASAIPKSRKGSVSKPVSIPKAKQ
jgi:hypothetical protein